MLNLAHSVITGMALGMVRAKQPEASKYLRLSHQGPLMWAPILFWLRGTTDEFAEKPPALYLGHLMTLAFIISLGLFGYAVVVGLQA